MDIVDISKSRTFLAQFGLQTESWGQLNRLGIPGILGTPGIPVIPGIPLYNTWNSWNIWIPGGQAEINQSWFEQEWSTAHPRWRTCTGWSRFSFLSCSRKGKVGRTISSSKQTWTSSKEKHFIMREEQLLLDFVWSACSCRSSCSEDSGGAKQRQDCPGFCEETASEDGQRVKKRETETQLSLGKWPKDLKGWWRKCKKRQQTKNLRWNLKAHKTQILSEA